MKRPALTALFLVFLTFAPSPVLPAEWAWLLSIPHALSGEQVYKVRILEIDGQPQKELIRYPVSPGAHTVTVQMLLDLEWEPDLTEGARRPPVKPFELEVEAGKTYLLAARVDIEAPAESQLDQSYWEPIVYRVD